MWEFFPSGGPPPPCLGMTRFFLRKIEKKHGLFCFLGGVSHVKNSKKWMWDSGRPPPVFSKFPHFPGFFWETSLRKQGYLYTTGWHTHLIGHHPVSLLGNVNCYPTTEVPVFFLVPASSNAKFAIFILEGKLGTVPPLVQLHCELQSFSIIWILHTAL